MRLFALSLLLIILLASTATSKAFGAPRLVSYSAQTAAGSIEVRHGERALYFVLGAGRAVRYPVAVPKKGQEWRGWARINGKYLRPAWSPPAVVKRDHPELPSVIPGGHPSNPMGEAALTLDRDQYAIHGTSAKMRGSIGTSASYGCVRMLNEDILDLFQRVQRGTPVLMLP